MKEVIGLNNHKKPPNDKSGLKTIDYLYKNSRQLLFKKAQMILKNDMDAEDAVQTAFMRFMKDPLRIRDFSFEENQRYLFISVKGIALDMLEKKSRETELTEDIPSTYNTEEAVYENITYEQIVNNINKLSPALKNVAVLFWAEHLSEQEIANALNMNINTVRSYVFRARKLLVEMSKEGNYD